MGKKRKRDAQVVQERVPVIQEVAPVRESDEPVAKRAKWKNRERVLIFSSRGISYRDRHLMNDMRMMMPHSKPDTKLDRKDKLFVINEICEMKNCGKCLFFEAKKKQDLYLWAANSPDGPSAKFLVENIHTMDELKMTGNCLKGSRPILSFDTKFDEDPHWALLKELFTQIFGTPNHHPKSQPFIDHVFTFSIADERIWLRNYQILQENGELAEIGPRMVLNPIRIFQGSFGGPTLYTNPHYTSPNEYRSLLRRRKGNKYADRIAAQKSREMRQGGPSYRLDPTDEVFQTS